VGENGQKVKEVPRHRRPPPAAWTAAVGERRAPARPLSGHDAATAKRKARTGASVNLSLPAQIQAGLAQYLLTWAGLALTGP